MREKAMQCNSKDRLLEIRWRSHVNRSLDRVNGIIRQVLRLPASFVKTGRLPVNQTPVILISIFLERATPKPRAWHLPYSRAFPRVRGVVKKVVLNKHRSDFQRVRGDRVAVKAGGGYG